MVPVLISVSVCVVLVSTVWVFCRLWKAEEAEDAAMGLLDRAARLRDFDVRDVETRRAVRGLRPLERRNPGGFESPAAKGFDAAPRDRRWTDDVKRMH